MTKHFAYDAGFDPPAPVLPMRLAAPGSEVAVLLGALVDTGADCTLIPALVAQRLRLPAIDRMVIEGVGGRVGTVTVHAATVELPGLTCLARVVAHGQECLIGRDLLARLAIGLDGPKAEISFFRTIRPSGDRRR